MSGPIQKYYYKIYFYHEFNMIYSLGCLKIYTSEWQKPISDDYKTSKYHTFLCNDCLNKFQHINEKSFYFSSRTVCFLIETTNVPIKVI